MTRNRRLSRAQIEQVARRVNAPEGQLVVFSRDGVVLHTHHEQRGTLALHDEIYSARRTAGEIEIAVERTPSQPGQELLSVGASSHAGKPDWDEWI